MAATPRPLLRVGWLVSLLLGAASVGAGCSSDDGNAPVDVGSIDVVEDSAPIDSALETIADSEADTPPDLADSASDVAIDADAGAVDSTVDTAIDADDAADTTVLDSGPLDTGPLDTGPLDTGPADTGPLDTGPPDTGPADTGPADTAETSVSDGADAGCIGDVVTYPATKGCPDFEWACWPISADSPGASNYTIATSCGDEVVIDKTTKLMWARVEEPGLYNWVNAKARCVGSRRGGFADWRLPTLVELQSIMDYGATTATTIDLTAFPSALSYWVWSSSGLGTAGMQAWFVSFGSGWVYVDYATNKNAVRCVR